MAEFKIRFISEGNLESGVVEFFEGGSQWSHVEIILPDGTYFGARESGGVAIRPADYVTTIVREKRYAIPVSDQVLSNIMSFAHSQIGKSYDIMDIVGIAIHKDLHDGNKWICSEFVAGCCLQAALYILNVEAEFIYKITPETLHLSPVLVGNCYYSVMTKQ